MERCCKRYEKLQRDSAFHIHTTVMKWNKDDIVDITDFAVEIGAVAHHTFFLVPTGGVQKLKRSHCKQINIINCLKILC